MPTKLETVTRLRAYWAAYRNSLIDLVGLRIDEALPDAAFLKLEELVLEATKSTFALMRSKNRGQALSVEGFDDLFRIVTDLQQEALSDAAENLEEQDGDAEEQDGEIATND